MPRIFPSQICLKNGRFVYVMDFSLNSAFTKGIVKVCFLVQWKGIFKSYLLIPLHSGRRLLMNIHELLLSNLEWRQIKQTETLVS